MDPRGALSSRPRSAGMTLVASIGNQPSTMTSSKNHSPGPASECVERLRNLVQSTLANADRPPADNQTLRTESYNETPDSFNLETQDGAALRAVCSTRAASRGKTLGGGASRSPSWDSINTPQRWAPPPPPCVICPPVTWGSSADVTPVKFTASWTEVSDVELPEAAIPGSAAYVATSTRIEYASDVDAGRTEAHASVGSLNTAYTCFIPSDKVVAQSLACQLHMANLSYAFEMSSKAVECADMVGLFLSAVPSLITARNACRPGHDSRFAYGTVTVIGPVRDAPPLLRRPLPKRGGFSLDSDPRLQDLIARSGAAGALAHPTAYALGMGYCVGAAGRIMGQCLAPLELGFMNDYSLPLEQKGVAEAFAAPYDEVYGWGTRPVHRYVKCAAFIKDMNFAALRYKASLEDAVRPPSLRVAAIWDDMLALTTYRAVDAGLCHPWYDSPPTPVSLVALGLGSCLVHDLLDLGSDVAAGEMSSPVLSICQVLDMRAIDSCYVTACGLLRWFYENDPFSIAGMALLYTHWWQVSNNRHRFIDNLICIDVESCRPPCVRREPWSPSIESVVASCRSRMTRDRVPVSRQGAADPVMETPEGAACLAEFAHPCVAWSLVAEDAPDTPPDSAASRAVILALTTARQSPARNGDCWRLALYMWEAGVFWHSCVAGLGYEHSGAYSDERARATYSEGVWK